MNVLIVSNERAGSGEGGLMSFVRELMKRRCEVTIRVLNEESPLALVLRDADRFDRVVAAGGDGTISSIAYELKNSGVPIVVFPAGTGNLIAVNLKMPITPAELADVTVSGIPVLTDMGEITAEKTGRTVGFVTAAGAGFDADIIEGARELKPFIGVGAYFVSAMRVIQPTISKFELELDGKKVQTEGMAVMLVNFAKLLFDLTVTHDSSAHDGEIEVVVLRSKSVAGLAPAVWAALLDRIGDHPDRSPSLEIHRAKTIRVSGSPALPLQYDGELLETTTPFEARVLPGAATFVVPASYSPQNS